jgi:hypothetical protein
VVSTGTQSITVAAGRSGSAFYRVTTPRTSGDRPLVGVSGTVVQVGQAAAGHAGSPDSLAIVLAPEVRWTIDLDGGTSVATVDMSSGELTALHFGGGVSSASVRLPPPRGTQTVLVGGGASELDIVATSGAPAQIAVADGASQVVFDGESHDGVAGGTVFADPAWSTAVDRYDVDLASGVAAVDFSRMS